MNHRKIRSEGSVPFSWEESPGVPKFSHQKSSDIRSHILPGNISPCIPLIIPPPPCTSRKSLSAKLLRQDDPFLAAFRSCTKTAASNQKSGHEEPRQRGKGGDKAKGKNRSNMISIFSCKHSCDVEADNLVKYTLLPKEIRPCKDGSFVSKGKLLHEHDNVKW